MYLDNSHDLVRALLKTGRVFGYKDGRYVATWPVDPTRTAPPPPGDRPRSPLPSRLTRPTTPADAARCHSGSVRLPTRGAHLENGDAVRAHHGRECALAT